MSDDDFYYKMDRENSRASELKAIRAKLDRGERISREDRAKLTFDEGLVIRQKIVEAMRGTRDPTLAGLSELVMQMMAISLAHTNARKDLEQRVVDLEEQLRSLRQPASASGPRLVSDSAGLRLGRAS